MTVQAIYKYILRPGEPVMMPARSGRMISVGVQGDDICLWASVDPMTRERPCTFHVVPTGGRVPDFSTFVGTVMLHGGALVFHVFEATP
ncbi:DUF7352 domain-containing protein [Roseomonas xinghualingensis]|uniref:DUF7352 domain-containing protein n=1 Tax=Roseomonas xinghualingensis TaxID=2986475 RepID=UPI0021F15001|nr:hypothetical protein [Roseomonas sp. SXEYE001]MCV4209883.1 hypothetical protein [Roseomonas sp. SXEYE001]